MDKQYLKVIAKNLCYQVIVGIHHGQLWDWETQDRQRETSQLFEDLTATRQDSSTRDDYLQTQADMLADVAISQAIQHREDITEIKESITAEKEARNQEISSAVASMRDYTDDVAASETQERKQADENLQDYINSVEAKTDNNSEQIQSLGEVHNHDIQNEREIREQADNVLQSDISGTRQEIQARGDYLQGQTDILADLAIKQALQAKEEQRARIAADESINASITEIQGDISGLESKDRDLQNQLDSLDKNLNHAELLRDSRDEHLQGQIDELAGSSQVTSLSIYKESQTRKEADINLHQEIQEGITNEADSRATSDEALSEDIEAAKAEVLEAVNQETQDRQESDAILQGDISATRQEIQARGDYLQGQADILAGMAISQAIKHESDIAGVKDLISQEAQQRKEILTHFAESQTERADFLQEQADLLSEAGQNIISTLFKEVESRKTLENVVKEIRSPIDWSKAESIAIPEPRCAIVNFSGINSMPTSKTADIPAVMEFWDMQGNYFKKNILCSAQGNSSMGYIKKNVKFDLLNEDGSEFNLKIGGWVVQDGFHLKAYYTDFFRGVGAVSYKFYDEIMRFNGLNTDRPYKNVLLNIEEISTNALGEGDISDLELQLDTGALCHPDGFPCIVYLNGEFYGIFSWQIKKQRKNYHLDKSTVEHIHLDGSLYTGNFWNGVINWGAFEIRNPNKLYTMDGKKYDGDSPKELIDETSAKYDPSNKDHKRSAQVKKYIQDLVTNFAELKSLYSTYRTSDPDRVKAKYEEIFDVDNQRDYLIFGDVIKNSDGFGKNWQWITYDGVKWFVTAYDLDMSFGGYFTGTQITPPLTGHITTSTAIPTGYIVQLYEAELKQRYQELRDAGIISTENIISKLEDWAGRIGTANYELEYSKWPNSPCIKNYNDSLYRVKKWLDTEIANMDKIYGYTPKDDRTKQEIYSEVDNLLTQQAGQVTQQIQQAQQENLSARETIRDNISSDISNQGQIRRDYDAGLQEQINILADMIRAKMLRERTESEELEARLTQIETALINGGVLEPSDIPVTTDSEISDRLDTILNLNS